MTTTTTTFCHVSASSCFEMSRARVSLLFFVVVVVSSLIFHPTVCRTRARLRIAH